MPDDTVRAALEYAEQASAVAAKLKPGGYDSVKALALISIAHSLAAIASAQDERSG